MNRVENRPHRDHTIRHRAFSHRDTKTPGVMTLDSLGYHGQRSTARRVCGRTAVTEFPRVSSQPDTQRNEEDTEHHEIHTDPQRDRERAGCRKYYEKSAEQDRRYAAECQDPFAANVLAKAYGGYN